MARSDPLYIVNPRHVCIACHNRRRLRRNCEACRHTGFMQIDLHGLWAPQPGFLVCGGPSLCDLPLEVLQERGVMSLGVNNAAAYARTDAAVFGDPQWKFHSSLFFDPKCMVFAPNGKLGRHVRMQDSETKEFYFSDKKLMDCPNVYGFSRTGHFDEKTFFTDWYVHWGRGGHDTDRDFTRLATMLMGIRLLHYLGCRTIYMLGVDFWMTKEKPYAWGGNRTSGNKIWWKIDTMLSGIKSVMKKAGVKIYNCNPETKSQCFPFVSFEDAIEHAMRPFGSEPPDLSQWYERGTMTQHKERHPDLVSDYIH